MKNSTFVLICIFTVVIHLPIFFISCSSTKQVSILNYQTALHHGTEVQILGQGQDLPADAKLIGSINIGDSGFSVKCGYSDVIKKAQDQARQMGGNILQITEHKDPDIWSTCHRIKADVYLINK